MADTSTSRGVIMAPGIIGSLSGGDDIGGGAEARFEDGGGDLLGNAGPLLGSAPGSLGRWGMVSQPEEVLR